MGRGEPRKRTATVARLVLLGATAALVGALVVYLVRATSLEERAAMLGGIVAALVVIVALVRSIVPTVSTTTGLARTSSASTVPSVPAPQAHPARTPLPVPVASLLVSTPDQDRRRQCPRCGDFDGLDEGAGPDLGCAACGHTFRWKPGSAWPDVVVRPALSGAASTATGESR
jgi:hypothetical protein